MSVISADTREQIEERERRPNWLVAQLRKPEWSPYAAGIMLGIVFAFSLLVAGQMPGSSGAFESLIAYLGSRIFPQNIYFRFVMPPGITWQVWKWTPANSPRRWTGWRPCPRNARAR